MSTSDTPQKPEPIKPTTIKPKAGAAPEATASTPEPVGEAEAIVASSALGPPNEIPIPATPSGVPTTAVPVSPNAQPAGQINLQTELVIAGLGAITSGLGSFVGAISVGGLTTLKSFYAALVGGAVAGVTFFSNSLRVWYQQKYGTTT